MKDIENMQDIFGKSIYVLKGKRTRKKTDAVVENYIAVPKEIMENTKM